MRVLNAGYEHLDPGSAMAVCFGKEPDKILQINRILHAA
jgi:hypothetical protein